MHGIALQVLYICNEVNNIIDNNTTNVNKIKNYNALTISSWKLTKISVLEGGLPSGV